MNYEILYIIPAKYSETEFEELNKKIPSILEESGASIVKTDNWGKRKLAYQIKHFRYGYYTLVIFSAPSEALEKITQKLNLNQDIIRFQIVKEIKGARKAVTVDGDDYMVNKEGSKPKESKKPFKKKEEPKEEKTKEVKPSSAKAMAGEEEKEEIKEEKKTKEIKEEPKEEKTKEVKEESKEPQPKADQPLAEKKKQEKKKASIDELDEKLDELLSDAL